jgi:type II secretory pathway pseudopilin PulG
MAGRSGTAGFTYIGLLLLVALMGFSLTVVSQVWQTKQKREREDELLFIGNQFRRAIEYYYVSTPGGAARFPSRLEDLLRDPRYPGVRRYLRRIYRDPMTGREEWGLVKTGERITGVHSLSDEAPLKKRGFRFADRSFADKASYADWVFFSRFDQGQVAKPAGASGLPGAKPHPGSGGAPSGANK